MHEQTLERQNHKTRQWVRVLARISRQVRFPGREKLLRSTLGLGPESFEGNQWFDEVIPYGQKLKIRCDPSSYLEWLIYMKGCYDFGITRLLPRLLRPGSYAVDVGANMGVYTLLMAECVGPKGRVASFEPNPEVFKRLLSNLELNQLSPWVDANPIALSSTAGMAKLYLPSADCRNRAVASMRANSEMHDQTIDVGMDVLDHALHSWPRFDFLKVDAEGHDAAVLKGSSQMIERFLPSMLFEYYPNLWPDSKSGWDELHDWLSGLGYQLYWLDTHWGRLKTIARMPERDGNMVALHPKTSSIKV
jgi:FkbM family methyltransferase